MMVDLFSWQPVPSHVEVPDSRVSLLDRRVVDVDFFGVNYFKDLHTSHRFDFTWVDPSSPLHASLLVIFRGMLSTHSLSYVSHCVDIVGRFIKQAMAKEAAPAEGLGATRHLASITMHHFENWANQNPVSYWPFLQATLNRWVDSRLPGLDAEVVEFLRQPQTFEERGSGAFFALVVNDPERGAFTEQELRNLRNSVNRAYEEGRWSLQEWALVWFLIATGVRPIQIARMLMSDVVVSPGPEGTEITLRIPLAKGENGVTDARWSRKAPTVLTEVLLKYLDLPHIKNRTPDAPLFGGTSQEIGRKITDLFEGVATYSTRLDGPIPVFPYRFRYTLGTRAIALGATDHEVARLLTHRQTACIHYYRRAMPQLQQPIRNAIGDEMKFLALAFQGRLIGSLDEATRKGEAGALIRDFAHLMGQKLGACGTRAECHQNAPRACLTCHKFEPLIDAPWEQFRDVLREDIEAETEDRIRLITQEQIAAVNEIIAQRNLKLSEIAG